jgi:hypothetical protein
MKNIPYVKKFDENGVLTNPITKDSPYKHPTTSTRTQKRAYRYVMLTHPVSGDYIGLIKRGGNNKKVAASTRRRKPSMKRRTLRVK